jgi:hypothetical protein
MIPMLSAFDTNMTTVPRRFEPWVRIHPSALTQRNDQPRPEYQCFPLAHPHLLQIKTQLHKAQEPCGLCRHAAPSDKERYIDNEGYAKSSTETRHTTASCSFRIEYEEGPEVSNAGHGETYRQAQRKVVGFWLTRQGAGVGGGGVVVP